MERIKHKFNIEAYKKRTSNRRRQEEIASNHQKLRKSYEAACKIMEMTMPKEVPEIEGYDLGGISESAKEFGGDFLTIFPIEENNIAVAVGDVAGKDLEAAFTMLMAKALFENESKYNTGPANVTDKVNKGLLTATGNNTAIITSIFGVLNPESGELSFARAGHEMPEAYRKDGSPYIIDRKDGQPLNFDENFIIHKGIIQLQKGDVLVLTTDGIRETPNPKGEVYGLEGLDESVKNNIHLPAEGMAEAIVKDAWKFEGNPLEPHDDRTVVIIKRL